MKLRILSVAATTLLSFGTAFADECNPASNRCTPSSPFDVTNSDYVNYITADIGRPDEFDGGAGCRTVDFCFSAGVLMGGDVIAWLQGMARFAEEMDDWTEANYWYQDYLYTQDKNYSRADYIAYAILDRSTKIKIKLSEDGDINTYREGTIIHGSDWDNNGKIDTLEIISEFEYNGVVISGEQ